MEPETCGVAVAWVDGGGIGCAVESECKKGRKSHGAY